MQKMWMSKEKTQIVFESSLASTLCERTGHFGLGAIVIQAAKCIADSFFRKAYRG